jgi:hypothetical protein
LVFSYRFLQFKSSAGNTMSDLFEKEFPIVYNSNLTSDCHRRPLPIDPWVASSLLQKSIRRGEAELATQAALTLFKLRRSGIWRRFMVIAFEDVGAASVDALLTAVRAGIDPTWRASVGSDERVIGYIARLLAEAPKDRSSDHLIGSSRSYGPFEEVRRMVGARSLAQRLDIVADGNQPLHIRAIAAWYSSGVEWDDEMRVGKGDLPGLTAAFRSIGVPSELAIATQHAAIRTREPITIMVPLIWHEAFKDERPAIRDCPVPSSPVVREVPLYALDMHTSIGKAAIHQFARECLAVRETLAEYVPEYRAQDAACMAAFYADAAPVSRRLDWSQSAALETIGTDSDLRSTKVSPDGVRPILEVVRANLDHLNEIRARLFGARRRGS